MVLLNYWRHLKFNWLLSLPPLPVSSDYHLILIHSRRQALCTCTPGLWISLKFLPLHLVASKLLLVSPPPWSWEWLSCFSHSSRNINSPWYLYRILGPRSSLPTSIQSFFFYPYPSSNVSLPVPLGWIFPNTFPSDHRSLRFCWVKEKDVENYMIFCACPPAVACNISWGFILVSCTVPSLSGWCPQV